MWNWCKRTSRTFILTIPSLLLCMYVHSKFLNKAYFIVPSICSADRPRMYVQLCSFSGNPDVESIHDSSRVAELANQHYSNYNYITIRLLSTYSSAAVGYLSRENREKWSLRTAISNSNSNSWATCHSGELSSAIHKPGLELGLMVECRYLLGSALHASVLVPFPGALLSLWVLPREFLTAFTT